MIRSISAVILGIVAWFAVATVGNALVRALLPGYSQVELAMDFTVPMQLARLAAGLASSVCAGAVCASIARQGRAVKVLAVAMFVLFLPGHYMVWAKFPVWYHAFFLLSLAPAVLAGAALRRRFASSVAASSGPADAR